ncbi:M56 family metallopeptidase [Rhodococcoides yunnanense]|uniref:M56 family metallopeptidase n=1 Tax=Rhodococcoides yunnanense TaxID=278209 RepID=A0ABU4BCN3_9NOCA|nr:M56 family metallopeptidase [Rhodococcus yunnanensis]MDV6261967.1 M56 family metallopeptidase [Rhodococcus yunnanensis]
MTAVLMWAFGGLVVSAAAPSLVRSMIARGVDAHVTLLTWSALVAGTLISIAVPVTLSAIPSHGGVTTLVDIAHQCWLAIHGDIPARVEAIVGVVGIAVLGFGAIRWIVHSRCAVHERGQLYDRHIDLLRIIGGDDSSGSTRPASTLWLPLDSPLAYSVAGRPAMVVASEGLRTQLNPAEVAAVLAHEHAHIDGRHHLLVGIAESAAYAFPWLPIMRESPALVRALVELDADARAARSHGPGPVRGALISLRLHQVPWPALGIASDNTAVRLDRLAVDRATPHAPLRWARAFAACTAVALPALPVLALLGTMALVSCAVG